MDKALQDRLEGVVKKYEKLIELGEKDPKLLKNLSDCYIRLGSFSPGAKANLIQAWESVPDDEEIVSYLGRKLLEEGADQPPAREVYEKFLPKADSRQKLPLLQKLEEIDSKEEKSDKARGWTRAIAEQYYTAEQYEDAVVKYKELYLAEVRDTELLEKFATSYTRIDEYNDFVNEVLLKTISEGPENKEIIDYLCGKYLQTGNRDENSVGVYRKAIEAAAFQDEIEVRTSLAQACYMNKKYDEAIEEARRTIELKPENSLAHLTLAKAHNKKGQPEEAIDAARTGLSHCPDDREILMALAGIYILQKETSDDAVTVYEKVYILEEKNDELVPILALAYVERDRRDEKAQAVYEEAIKIDPDDKGLLRITGEIMIVDSNGSTRAEGIGRLNRLIELGEEDDEIYLKLAHGYCADGAKDEKAVRVYERMIETFPEDTEINRMLKDVCLENKTSEEKAIPVFRFALGRNPKDTGLRFRLAEILEENEKLEEARAECEQVLSTDFTMNDARDLLARINIELGDLDDAITQYEKLYKADPGNKVIVGNLADAYRKKGFFDADRISVYEKAVVGDPGNAKLNLALGRAYSGAGKWEKSVKRYTEAHKLDPALEEPVVAGLQEIIKLSSDSPDPHLALGDIYYQTDDPDRAFISYLKFRDLAPDRLSELNERLESMIAGESARPEWKRSLAEIYAEQNEHEKAVLHAGGLLEGSDDPKLRDWTIAVYHKWADHEAELTTKIELLEKAYGMDRESSESVGLLEQAYRAKIDAAADDCNTQNLLGTLLRTEGRLADAIEILQGAKRSAGEDKDLSRTAGYQLGLAFADDGDLVAAIEEIKDAIADETVAPENVEIFYDLAELYQKEGDLDKARDIFTKIKRFNYSYRDVATRIKGLIESLGTPGTPSPAPGVGRRQADTETQVITDSFEDSQYEVLEELGEGGMGRVFKARDVRLDRLVAIKEIRPELRTNQKIVRRFLQEARASARLQHPNIVMIYDAAGSQGEYLVLEYVEGRSLRYMLDEHERLEVDEGLRIVSHVCAGLEHAHGHGIIHRDIKPSNIMLASDGTAKILDFGLGKIRKSSFMVSQQGELMGTLAYMPPEQHMSATDVDERADIFAVGVVAYEMFTGRLPFTGSDLYLSKTKTRPERPSSFYSEISPALEDVILRCMAVEKEERYANAADLQKALSEAKAPERVDDHVLDQYRTLLRMFWADGKLTESEESMLAEKRRELDMSDEEAERLDAEIRAELGITEVKEP